MASEGDITKKDHDAFLEKVFKLHAVSKSDHPRIDFQGLLNIFSMINFQPNKDQLIFYEQAFRQKDGTLGTLFFPQFIRLFKLETPLLPLSAAEQKELKNKPESKEQREKRKQKEMTLFKNSFKVLGDKQELDGSKIVLERIRDLLR